MVAAGWRPPTPIGARLGRSLIWHEDVGDVVHERGYGHGVDRLQVEDHPRLEVVQHLRIGQVQMRLVCVVSAHYDSLSCRSGLTRIASSWAAYVYTGPPRT